MLDSYQYFQLACTCTIVALLPLLVKIWYIVSKGRFTSDIDLTGKTVLITGANRGIGIVVAKDLASRGAKVILACRNCNVAKDAAYEISKTTGCDRVTTVSLDLSDFDSVGECASNVLRNEERLDYLINNAGIIVNKTGILNNEGIETHFATNHFGHYLLTMLLLPLMIKTGKGRIVNLSSYFHFFGRIDLNDIYGRPGMKTEINYRMYANTKLANVLFTRQLAKYLKNTDITVNAVNPGNTESDIAVDLPRSILTFGFLIRWFCLKKTEEGAETVTHAILSPELDEVSGQYLSDCGIAISSFASKKESTMTWLWDFSQRVTRAPTIQEVFKMAASDKDYNSNSFVELKKFGQLAKSG